VDELMSIGGLRYLSVNLSTLDGERYRRDREAEHLPGVVLRNLAHVKDIQLAPPDGDRRARPGRRRPSPRL
jgi:hypothetical protein